jgi:TfoX/Sxy family transcriptional regulator of competence genes
MSYDETLASRVRGILAATAGDVVERKMFGGLCFMVEGAMCCGVLGPDLIVRVGPAAHDDALGQPGTRAFDFTGRPSRGMVYVGPDAIRTDEAVESWVRKGLAYAAAAAGQRRNKR